VGGGDYQPLTSCTAKYDVSVDQPQSSKPRSDWFEEMMAGKALTNEQYKDF